MGEKDYSELEQQIRDEFVKVEQLDTIRQVPLSLWLPTDYVAHGLGFDNYRPPSITGLQHLAQSIQTVGLLEKPVLNIMPDTGEIIFFDGRRRMGACVIANYEEVPFEIYSVPQEEMAELELSLNALKTKIPTLDKIQKTEKLIEELSVIEEWKDSTLNKELASILHCTPTTISGYRTYLDAHEDIQNYSNKHRNLRLYTQIKQIVQKIPDKNQQNQFFAWYKNDRLEKIDTKTKKPLGKLGPRPFSQKLNEQAEIFAEERRKRQEKNGLYDDLTMIVRKEKNYTYKQVKDVAKRAKKTMNYLNMFTRLLALDSNLQDTLKSHPFENGGLQGFVTYFKEEFETYLAKAPEKIQTKIGNLLEHKIEASFAQTHLQKILSLQSGTKKGRPMVYGEKAEFIPVEQIETDPENLRKAYENERIQGLAKDFKQSGQIKAGIVRKIEGENGVRYRCVVGNTRLQAVVVGGIKYYKAYVMEEIDSAMITILQAAEDLFEDDGYYARALKLYDNYLLNKKFKEEQGITYTPEMFIEDKTHLAPKKTIQDAMYVMSLSDITQYVIKEKFMSAEAGKFMEEVQLTDSDKLAVIINAATNKYNTKQVKEYIQHNLLQPSLFDTEETHSYAGVITNFQNEIKNSLAQLKYVCMHKGKGGELLQNSQQVFLRFARVYQELNGLAHGIGLFEEEKK